MSCSRRDFLKQTVASVAAAAMPAATFVFLTPEQANAMVGDSVRRWIFLVDTEKCTGCGLCVKACKIENEIPYDAPVSRTWVERYVVTKDGQTHIDSPNAGRDGFTTG